jgi:flagellar biosynthesis/type III secretory pathway chaperone
MATIDELERVLNSEADLAEALCNVLAEKQQAIVGFEADRLAGLTTREEELMVPFHAIEEERARLTGVLLGPKAKGKSLHALREGEQEGERDSLSAETTRLRSAMKRLVKINDQNRILLQQGLRFVRESLRIVTDNNRRRLVDHRA